MIALNITEPDQIISSTTIEGLDLITSNDSLGQLPDYDVILALGSR
ncbi:hypothetical protein [Halomonas eurihalina]